MCIIVVKKRGFEIPKKEILKNCYDNNGDGVGYMYANNNMVHIKKGFFDFDEFYNSIINDYESNDLKEKNLVIHFRIATHGGTTKEKTHPFILSNKKSEFDTKKTNIETFKNGIVHNGILSDYGYNSKYSDTQLFVSSFMYPLLKMNHFKNNDIIKKIVESEIGTSKVVMLDRFDELTIYNIGEFVESDSILYSNKTYSYSYKNYFSKTNSYNVGDYDDDESELSDYYGYNYYYDKYYDDTDFLDYYTIINDRTNYKFINSKVKYILVDSQYEIENDYNYNYYYYIDKDSRIYEIDKKNKYVDYIGTGELYDDRYNKIELSELY